MTKEEIKKDFLFSVGKVIQTKRLQKNISQQELSEYLEVSKSTVSRYERGICDIPVSLLPLISNYCGFPITDYVYEDRLKRATQTFGRVLYNSVTGESADKKDFTEKQKKRYNIMLLNVNGVLKEGTDIAIDVLYNTGMLLDCVKDNETAREISVCTLDYLCGLNEHINKCSRIGRQIIQDDAE